MIDAKYAGERGGCAIANVLFGEYNPAGRLPLITFPMTEGQLPLYENHKPTGRGDDYLALTGQPLFPFGFGLSYTSIAHSGLVIDPPTIRRVLVGVSAREYQAAPEAVPEAFGIAKSSVSRHFSRASAEALRQSTRAATLIGNRLSYSSMARRSAEDQVVIALGVTTDGEKRVLGLVQTATENKRTCAAFVRELIARRFAAPKGYPSCWMARRDCAPPYATCLATTSRYSAVSGTNAKTSSAICQRRSTGSGGENSRPRVRTGHTMMRSVPCTASSPNWRRLMPPPRGVWKKGSRKRSRCIGSGRTRIYGAA